MPSASPYASPVFVCVRSWKWPALMKPCSVNHSPPPKTRVAPRSVGEADTTRSAPPNIAADAGPGTAKAPGAVDVARGPDESMSAGAEVEEATGEIAGEGEAAGVAAGD